MWDFVKWIQHHDGEEEAGGGGHAMHGGGGPDGDDDAEHRFDWKTIVITYYMRKQHFKDILIIQHFILRFWVPFFNRFNVKLIQRQIW